jgi:hypothetical protein
MPPKARNSSRGRGARNFKIAVDHSNKSVFRSIAQYFVLDADLGARQDEWNAQWQQQKK